MDSTTPTTRTWADLQRSAIQAHQASTRWLIFWMDVAPDVAVLHPHNRDQFRKAYQRLMHLWATGDAAGQEPPGSAPWEQDDAAPVERVDFRECQDTSKAIATQPRARAATDFRRIEANR